MIADPIDRRAAAIFCWVLLLLLLADGLAARLHLKWLQSTEWPTDLYTLQTVDRHVPWTLGIAGSSRSHYALSPSALDRCLLQKTGRRSETLAANRMRASAYTIDITARDLFPDVPVLLAEVAPESFNAHHFELDYSISSNADIPDVPECLGAALRHGEPRLASCARPLLRGVENIAFLLHRPWTDHRHIEWMALYHGGGQYCYDDPECIQRNNAYDAENRLRWDSRVKNILPDIGPQRFARYTVGGLPAAHFVAMLQRAQSKKQAVFLVNLPVHAFYQAQIPPQNYQDWLQWVRSTAAAYGAHFLDYNLPSWQNNRALFLDPDHLNSQGALQLSEAVCGEVLPALH